MQEAGFPITDSNNPDSRYQQARQRFEVFRQKRRDWQALVRREKPISLPPTITGDIDPVDYQTPDLEDQIFTHRDKLMANPTYFDLKVTSGESEDNKKRGRDILLWTARSWLRFDDRREWDMATSEDQVGLGIAITRLLTTETPEPETRDLKTREESLRRARYFPFSWERIDPTACAWLPVASLDPEAFWYEYELSYIDARERFTRVDGKEVLKLVLNRDERLEWRGDEEPLLASEQSGLRTVTVLVEDARDPGGRKCPIEDCDHVQRVITTYVRGSGDRGKGEIIDAQDSPFHACSFVITPGRRSNAIDPNWRYRPLMLPSYAEASYLNFLITTYGTMALADYSDHKQYINASSVPAHLAAWFEAITENGSKLNIDLPPPGSSQMAILPEVLPYPKQVGPHLETLRAYIAQQMAKHAPNPYMTGEAFKEAQQGTGTAYTLATQQAALPYDALLKMSDASIRHILGQWWHAIRFWAAGDDRKTELAYYAVTDGSENLMSAGAKGGEITSISASKLDAIDFEIVLETSSEDLAEQATRWNLAKDKFHEGVSTADDLIREAGYRDVIAKKKELRIARYRAELDPSIAPFRLDYVKRKLELKAGLNFGVGLGGLMPPPGEAGAPPPPTGTGPEGITGRFIAPPPVGGVSGGSSAVGGV